MAQLHDHTEQFVAACSPRPTRWALLCEVSTWQQALRKATAVFPPVALAVLTTAAQWVQATVQDLGDTRDVYGFIHADLHQRNYLFHGTTVGAIDFDDCGWGYYAYDMAVTLSNLEHLPVFPALQEAFLTGYQSVWPLRPLTLV
jgi:Ser/Thr protein kinase RdoA (MazF antagonist)